MRRAIIGAMMRTASAICCAAAVLGVAHVAAQTERLEFSGLESPCDEMAGDHETSLAGTDDRNDNITAQIEDLWDRVDNELITYGDTTNVCSST